MVRKREAWYGGVMDDERWEESHDGRDTLVSLALHATLWTALLVGMSYAFARWG